MNSAGGLPFRSGQLLHDNVPGLEGLPKFLASMVRGNGTAGGMVKVGHSGVQVEKALRALDLAKAKLLSFLPPGRSVRLLDQVVAARGGDDLLMVDLSELIKLSNGGTVTGEFVGINDLRHVIFTQ